MAAHGKPQSIRCDNGPELTSRHFPAWAIAWKIDLIHIQPGKPTQKGGMESFNGKLRDECLNVSWFWNLFDARRQISSPAQLAGLSNSRRVRAAVAGGFSFSSRASTGSRRLGVPVARTGTRWKSAASTYCRWLS
jgi:putative transposase